MSQVTCNLEIGLVNLLVGTQLRPANVIRPLDTPRAKLQSHTAEVLSIKNRRGH